MEVEPNVDLLARLVRNGQIELERLPEDPPALPSAATFDRVEGMLLGLAIGDALGNTTEARLPARRQAEHGEIRDYLPNRYADGRRVGLPSDDTQLAFWTVEHLLERGRLEPASLSDRFAAERIFGMGSSVREFVRMLAPAAPGRNAAHAPPGTGRSCGFHRYFLRICARLAGDSRPTPCSLPSSRTRIRRPQRHVWPSCKCSGNCSAPSALRIRPGGCANTSTTPGSSRATTLSISPVAAPSSSYAGPGWSYVDLAAGDALERGLSARAACDRAYSGAVRARDGDERADHPRPPRR